MRMCVCAAFDVRCRVLQQHGRNLPENKHPDLELAPSNISTPKNHHAADACRDQVEIAGGDSAEGGSGWADKDREERHGTDAIARSISELGAVLSEHMKRHESAIVAAERRAAASDARAEQMQKQLSSVLALLHAAGEYQQDTSHSSVRVCPETLESRPPARSPIIMAGDSKKDMAWFQQVLAGKARSMVQPLVQSTTESAGASPASATAVPEAGSNGHSGGRHRSRRPSTLQVVCLLCLCARRVTVMLAWA